MSLFMMDWSELSLQVMLTFVHFLWQGCLIAIVLAVAEQASNMAGGRARAFRSHEPQQSVPDGLRRSAKVRYLMAYLAFVALPVCVAATFTWVHQSRGPILMAVSAAVESPALVVASINERMELDAATDITVFPSMERTAGAGLPVAEPLEASAPMVRALSWMQRTQAYTPYLLIAYAFGATFMLARFGVSILGSTRLCRTVQPIVDSNLLKIIAEQSSRLGLKRVPMVAFCQRVSVPVVVGIVKPMILLPPSLLCGLDPNQLAAILSHEMAHVRRYDLLINLLQRVVEALLFFHPVTWWISRRIRIERENCCDDMAVTGCGRIEYAAALFAMAEQCATIRGLKIAPQLDSLAADGGNASQLGYRIRRLLGEDDSPRIPFTRVSLAAITLAVVFGGLSMVAVARSDDDHWGDESHGLVCHILPVSPSMDPESVDMNAAVERFASPDDLTIAVELKNVGNQPIHLNDVRYGNGYAEETRGKLNTNHYAPHLFEFTFTDGAGKAVAHTQREFTLDSHALILRGAYESEIDTGWTPLFIRTEDQASTDNEVETFVYKTLQKPYRPEHNGRTRQTGAHRSTIWMTLASIPQQDLVADALMKKIEASAGSVDFQSRQLALDYCAKNFPDRLLPYLIRHLSATAFPAPDLQISGEGRPFYGAIHAIGDIGEQAKAAIPALTKQLFAGNPIAREATIRALVRVGPSDPEVMLSLTECFNDDNERVQSTAVYEAVRYGKLAKPLGPRFAELLDAESKEVQYWAAAALITSEFDPDLGFRKLLEGASTGSTADRRQALTALAMPGTRSVSVLPKLRAMADDPDVDVARAVRKAIRRIETNSKVEGRVIDAVGKPIVGASISCLAYSGDEANAFDPVYVETDRDGYFKARNPKEFSFTMRHAGGNKLRGLLAIEAKSNGQGVAEFPRPAFGDWASYRIEHSSGHADFKISDLPPESDGAAVVTHRLKLLGYVTVQGRYLPKVLDNEFLEIYHSLPNRKSVDGPAQRVELDDEGRFTLTPRLAGWHSFVHRIQTIDAEGNRGTSAIASYGPFDLKPGESRRLTLGDEGSSVVGRLSVPEPSSADFGSLTIQAYAGGPFQYPHSPRGLNDHEELAWWDAYWESEAGHHFRKYGRRNITVPVSPDGSFHFPMLPPGDYKLRVFGRTTGRAPWKLNPSQLLIPDGARGSVVDLGSLKASEKKFDASPTAHDRHHAIEPTSWIPVRPQRATVNPAGTAIILDDHSVRLEGDVRWQEAARCIDHLSDTGWKVPNLPADAAAHELVLRFENPITLRADQRLTFTADSGGADEFAVLNRIRFTFHQAAVREPADDKTEKGLAPSTTPETQAIIDAVTGKNQAEALRPLITPHGMDPKTTELIKFLGSPQQVAPLMREIIAETPALLEPLQGVKHSQDDARWNERWKLVHHRLKRAIDVLLHFSKSTDTSVIDLTIPCFPLLRDDGGEELRLYLTWHLAMICQAGHLDPEHHRLSDKHATALRTLFWEETKCSTPNSNAERFAYLGLGLLSDAKTITTLIEAQNQSPIGSSHAKIVIALSNTISGLNENDAEALRIKASWIDSLRGLSETSHSSDKENEHAQDFATVIARTLYQKQLTEDEERLLRTLGEETKVAWLKELIASIFDEREDSSSR